MSKKAKTGILLLVIFLLIYKGITYGSTISLFEPTKMLMSYQINKKDIYTLKAKSFLFRDDRAAFLIANYYSDIGNYENYCYWLIKSIDLGNKEAIYYTSQNTCVKG